MSSSATRGSDGGGTRDADIAATIRRLSVALHATTVDDEAAEEVLGQLEAVHSLLVTGEQRRRWYEPGSGDGRPRTANRDLSVWSGAINAAAPPMTISDGVRADGTACVRGLVRLDRLREGPPRSAHGGVVAGLFDEILGAAQRLTGRLSGVTARLAVRYRHPTPIDEDLTFEAWIHDERTRRVTTRAHCLLEGDVLASAEGMFLRVDFAGLEAESRSRSAGRPGWPGPS